MRLLGSTFLVAATALSACAGPSDPAAADQVTAYRTGSRVRQVDGPQPTLSYYGPDQLSHSSDQTLGSAIAHAPATPVPPPQQ